MTGHVIFFVEDISDPEQLKKYQKAAHPTIGDFGGKVTIAYGRQEIVEGGELKGVVMVEFPTFEAAQQWYHSTAYQEAAALRKFAARTHTVIVEARQGPV
jgi:uncharacterized protein (DUF1330 family)